MHTAVYFCKKCNYGEPGLLQGKSTGNKMPLIFKTLKHFLPVWLVDLNHAVLAVVYRRYGAKLGNTFSFIPSKDLKHTSRDSFSRKILVTR